MKWEKLSELGRALPEVVEGLWYRIPALKVAGKGFVRLKEDGRSVVFVLSTVEEQEFLIESQPKLYFMTDHYRGYAMVLAHLAKLTVPEARLRLERAWTNRAPKKLLLLRGK